VILKFQSRQSLLLHLSSLINYEALNPNQLSIKYKLLDAEFHFCVALPHLPIFKALYIDSQGKLTPYGVF